MQVLDLNQLATLSGLTAALIVLTQIAKLLWPKVQGVATVRLVVALGLLGSLGVSLALHFPPTGLQVAQAIWTGLLAAGGAIGINVGTDAVRRPDSV